MPKIKVFFDNKRGVRVTGRTFSTRLKDEDLIHIRSVKVGRAPLYFASVLALSFALFALQFREILYPHEQMALLALCIVLLAAGYSLASLTIGTLFNDKTMFWYDYWTVKKVRTAMFNAQEISKSNGIRR